MGKAAVPTSPALGNFLRQQRIARGWSLREVEERCRSYGRPIPFTTLAKVERGRIDPGLRRLAALFKVYDLPLSLAQDVIDLEEMAAAPRTRRPDRENSVERWRAGDLRGALAELAELRLWSPADAVARRERQEQLLTLSVYLGGLGKNRLARLIVDELLCEPPVDELKLRILGQAAVCWKRLGAGDTALGLLGRAAELVDPADGRQVAWLHHQTASVLVSLGEAERASGLLEEALATYRASGDDYGTTLALGLRVRIARARGRTVEAYEAAREARAHATRHGFERLAAIRAIDEGRALVEQSGGSEGLAELRSGLAHAVATQDRLMEFYGHYCLWKAHQLLGDVGGAQAELRSAQFFVQFVDLVTPEAAEVRALIPTTRGGRTVQRRRSAPRSRRKVRSGRRP
jgi:transcriptional regulator with XRE-family HTH domain